MPHTDEAAARLALARLRQDPTPVTWSAGLAVWQPDDDIDACLARADRALYGSKLERHADRA